MYSQAVEYVYLVIKHGIWSQVHLSAVWPWISYLPFSASVASIGINGLNQGNAAHLFLHSTLSNIRTHFICGYFPLTVQVSYAAGPSYSEQDSPAQHISSP